MCGNGDLVKVLDLGSQAATGTFPKSAVFNGPLKLIKCIENPSGDTCGLVQLGHRYDPAVLCGDHYGYRSGLNSSMVAHLRGKAERTKQRVALTSGDAILDIGSNDGTFFATLIEPGVTALGLDPSAEKFREFLSAAGFRRHFGAQKLQVVTSIAMFYESCTRNLNQESITESL